MPYIVPSPGPDIRGEQWGTAINAGVSNISDLLLKALLSGQLGQIPQQSVQPTGNIQNMQLSGGRQFSGTPQAAQRLIPQDIMKFQDLVNRGALPASGLPSGLTASPTGASRLGIIPNLDMAYKQSEINKNTAQTKMYDKIGTVGSITLPDGTVIPALNSPSGPKPLNEGSLTGSNAKDNLSEKSYTHHSTLLDQAQKPIDERIDRLSRLQDTINQVSPQADALIAPELLTVMAGGQGSGLRMNEAEIARIIGGRTNLERLKAALNKWNVDPSKGLSVTPAQRQQIRSLVDTVERKLTAKREIINNAREQLISASGQEEHRRIFFQAQKELQGIDKSSSDVSPDVTGQAQALPMSPSAQRLIDRYRGK